MKHKNQRGSRRAKTLLLSAVATGAILLGMMQPVRAQETQPAAPRTDVPKEQPQQDIPEKTLEKTLEKTPAAEVSRQAEENVPAEQAAENAASGKNAAQGTGNQPDQTDTPSVAVPVAFDPRAVIDRARNLATQPFENPHRDLPEVLAKMSAREYGRIRFKSQKAFFNRANSGFSLEMFHPGNMYDVPVAINLVRDGQVQAVPYSAGLFDFGKTDISANDFSTQGYAGFRLRYPLSNIDSNDELARFLGASYFRLQGQGQSIGQMARGLAIDLAGPSGEEIPVFREFWIVEPKAGEHDITVYALLDSPRLTGAYRFDILPGADSRADITAHLFFRDGIEKIGLAPLNGMFLFGEQRRRPFDDYRSEVHSSDGLLINNGRGEWLWRPLDNPENLQISSFLDENPRGFGLLQRDRDFDHYQDLDHRFDQQPGYWITPKGDWGKGHVELVEIPSPSESNDNIVAYWVPEAKPEAGGALKVEYSITATRAGDDLHAMARATDTRLMRIPAQGSDAAARTRFVLNFAGGNLGYFLPDIEKISANISASQARVENTRIMADPENGGIRVIFDVLRDGDAASSNLRAFIQYDDRVLSETWTMPWVF